MGRGDTTEAQRSQGNDPIRSSHDQSPRKRRQRRLAKDHWRRCVRRDGKGGSVEGPTDWTSADWLLGRCVGATLRACPFLPTSIFLSPRSARTGSRRSCNPPWSPRLDRARAGIAPASPDRASWGYRAAAASHWPLGCRRAEAVAAGSRAVEAIRWHVPWPPESAPHCAIHPRGLFACIPRHSLHGQGTAGEGVGEQPCRAFTRPWRPARVALTMRACSRRTWRSQLANRRDSPRANVLYPSAWQARVFVPHSVRAWPRFCNQEGNVP